MIFMLKKFEIIKLIALKTNIYIVNNFCFNIKIKIFFVAKFLKNKQY